MATELTVQPLTNLLKANATMTSCAAAMKFVCTGGEYVVIFRTTDSGNLTVVFHANPCDQGFSTLHDVTLTMATGTNQISVVGPFEPARFAHTYDTTDNAVEIAISGTMTNATIGVFRKA